MRCGAPDRHRHRDQTPHRGAFSFLPQTRPPRPGRPWTTTASALLLGATLGGHGAAATLVVGEGQPVATVAQAARLARDGDTVLIQPGVYRGDVAVWTQRSLEIRGGDPRPVFDAAGQSAEGKGIWVFRDGDFRVENIEFRGARVPDGNGAGIRFERGNLTIRSCIFRDNQMGLLTGNSPDSTVTILDSTFEDASHEGKGLHHLIYVGSIAAFDLEGSRVQGGHIGHLVKSRARQSTLSRNMIVDRPGGRASYELDFPNGGDVLLVENVIGQSAASENRTMLAYGAEGIRWQRNRLQILQNTFRSDGWRPAWALRIWDSPSSPQVELIVDRNTSSGGPFFPPLPGDRPGPAPIDCMPGMNALGHACREATPRFP